MSKDYKIYLKDILESISYIEKFILNIDFSLFTKNRMIYNAVIREFEIIGEAAKRVPKEFREKHENIDWSGISGLRDILIHQYSKVNLKLIWQFAKTKNPLLKKQINSIIKNHNNSK